MEATSAIADWIIEARKEKKRRLKEEARAAALTIGVVSLRKSRRRALERSQRNNASRTRKTHRR